MNLFDLLSGNSPNLMRSFGASMAANVPGSIMSRGPYRGLGGTGGIAGPSGPPGWSTPPFVPQAPRYTPPLAGMPQTQPGRFPRMQSVASRLGGLFANGNPMFDLGLGLLAGAGPRPAGTGNFGADLANAAGFASQRQDARTQREEIQRQLEEIEKQKQASAQFATQLDALIKSKVSPDLQPILSAMAQENPSQAFGVLAGMPGILGPAPPPKLSETGEKLRDVRAALGRELTEKESLTLAGGGSLFDVASDDELDKVLSTSDLESYRLPDGSKLTPGSTLRDAKDAGALPYSATEITQQRAAESADVTLDELEKLSIGDGGVHIGAGGGPVTNTWPGRVMHGAANATGTFFGTEDSRQRDLYNRMREAFIASIARSRGESGSLSDADIARIVGALPDLGATPMTEEQARKQWEVVRKIYGAANKPRSGRTGAPIDLGGGVSLSF